MKVLQKDIDRFYSHIITNWKSLPNECWEMDLFHDKDNYPRIHFNNTTIACCRLSYLIHNGPIPKNMQVRHMCHNSKCVNPKHLLIGTSQDNQNDKVNANRQAKGTNNGMAILTESDVITILTDIYNNKYNELAEICKIYNVSRYTINNIFNQTAWKHITDKLTVSLSEIKSKIIMNNYNIGNKNPNSKLNDTMVREMKLKIKNGIPLKTISKEYGISYNYASNIKNNKYWKHVQI